MIDRQLDRETRDQYSELLEDFLVEKIDIV